MSTGFLYLLTPDPCLGPCLWPPICVYLPWPTICGYQIWHQICVYKNPEPEFPFAPVAVVVVVVVVAVAVAVAVAVVVVVFAKLLINLFIKKCYKKQNLETSSRSFLIFEESSIKKILWRLAF